MVKNYEPVEAASSYDDNDNFGPLIGGIRIAKVTYEHHPIRQTKNGTITSIGGMIDEHIANIVAVGDMISEVSIFFETAEQQEAVANMYRAKRRDY